MRASLSSDMVTVSNTGPTEHITRVSGISTKLKAKEHSGMQKEMCTMVSSGMIWPMGMECTLILTVASIKVNSKMMFRRVMAKKNGSMVPSTLELILTE